MLITLLEYVVEGFVVFGLFGPLVAMIFGFVENELDIRNREWWEHLQEVFDMYNNGELTETEMLSIWAIMEECR